MKYEDMDFNSDDDYLFYWVDTIAKMIFGVLLLGGILYLNWQLDKW
jgi:hypothetical protein